MKGDGWTIGCAGEGCDGAGWVPFRFEIEHHIWVFVERKVLAEVLEITECFYGAEVG